MEDTYRDLADLYDEWQSGLDAKAWAAFIRELDQLFNRRRKTGDGRDGRPILVDLGCGTGAFCEEMEELGYDTIGIDASAAMLDRARSRCPGGTLYLRQDISRFELYGTADLMVCLLDTVNHLARPSQAERLFRLCANYLNPGGLFIFDAASRRYLENTLGNQCFYQDADEWSMLWQNRFRPESGISRSEILIFRRCQDGRYSRQETAIVERFYSPAQIRGWIRGAGLEMIAWTKQTHLKPPAGRNERIFYVARKPMAGTDSSPRSQEAAADPGHGSRELQQ